MADDQKQDSDAHPAEPILAALGSFTYAWSGLQISLEMFVWALLGIDEQRGRIVTSNMQTLALIEMLQTILNVIQIPEDERPMMEDMIKGLKNLNAKRNNIIHSHWTFDEGSKDYTVLRSSRNLGRGQLKKTEKIWTIDDLMNRAAVARKMSHMLDIMTKLARDAAHYHATRASTAADKP